MFATREFSFKEFVCEYAGELLPAKEGMVILVCYDMDWVLKTCKKDKK